MKLRAVMLALMISLVLLSGCSPGNAAAREEFERFRDGLGEISMTAALRADFGESVMDFVLGYSEDGESCRVSVIEPELIHGSGAVFSREGALLEYEGVRLSVGERALDGTAPVTVLPAIAAALRGWQLMDVRQEGGLLAAELSDLETSRATVWFNEGMIPVKAELSCAGYLVASCVITGFK